MTDFARARRTMVDCQIRPNDVPDSRVVDAFLATERERFVPGDKHVLAYLDRDVPLGGGRQPRALTSPMVLAKLIHAAGVRPTDRALVVGAASGYSAAILSHLCQSVVALEADESLIALGKSALTEVANVSLVSGPLEAGVPQSGPYDVILVDGSVEGVPGAVFAQLRDGGRLVAVVGAGRTGRATVYVKSGGDVAGRIAFDAAAPSLPGFARPPAFSFQF
jgi:protein-L-isoaspartate(D-aspartate) O-methyltransferase